MHVFNIYVFYFLETPRRTIHHSDSITSEDSDLTAWKRSIHNPRDANGSKQTNERCLAKTKLQKPAATPGGEILINSSLGFKDDDDVTGKQRAAILKIMISFF